MKKEKQELKQKAEAVAFEKKILVKERSAFLRERKHMEKTQKGELTVTFVDEDKKKTPEAALEKKERKERKSEAQEKKEKKSPEVVLEKKKKERILKTKRLLKW